MKPPAMNLSEKLEFLQLLFEVRHGYMVKIAVMHLKTAPEAVRSRARKQGSHVS